MNKIVNEIKEALNNAVDAADENNKDYSVVYLPDTETVVHMEAEDNLEAYGYEVITTIRVT